MYQLSDKELKQNNFPLEYGVHYKQGMTHVWSDGEKVIVRNRSGIRWVKDNVEQIFGMGEWDKIQNVAYSEREYLEKPSDRIKYYECTSGYIPQRVTDDLAEELPHDEKKKAALEALRETE